MAACGSLQHIFENPLPENPTLLESLSPWNQIKPVNKPPNIEQSSFTEIFGELHFKENSLFLSSSSSSSSAPVSSSSSSSVDSDLKTKPEPATFLLRNSESLQLCTEGLGFESSDYEAEDLTTLEAEKWRKPEDNKPSFDVRNVFENVKRSKTASAGGGRGRGGFPPPISCLSKSGKPWVCFKSYREDGRFVLKEIRVKSREFLHACREDGRLKLHFVQPNDEDEDDKDEEEEEDDKDEDDDEEDDGENGEQEGMSETIANE